MPEKLPPHNIDAEEAVLGSLLLGADINTSVLTGEDFYSERNRWIYESCKLLVDKSVSINTITLAEELARKGKLESIGSAAFLSHLIESTPTSLDFGYYAEIVGRMSVYRKIINISEQIADIGYQADSNIADAIGKADNLLLDLRKDHAPSAIITPEQRVELLNERYETLYQIEAGAATPIGLRDVDKFIGGGLYDGDLVILGARPSMGKTTLLQNMANSIARTNNVLFCSCEMDTAALSDRDVAGLVGVPTNTIRLGGYTSELYTDILASLETIRETNLFTYDDTPITTDKIMQAATNLKLRFGLKAIFVDYLGLLDDDIKENRNITLGHMTKKLKQIARKLNLPVIAAHQLSRSIESRDDKRPMLSDLRESGHIEEDADVVLFLYRDSYYYDPVEWSKKSSEPYPDNITEVIVAKQRQGESNRTIRVYFDKVSQKFRDLARV